MKALINADLFDFETYKKNQYVLFDKEIIDVGSMDNCPNVDRAYDCKGSIVTPGLVLGHSHIYSTFARGWITRITPNSFEELLQQMWWKLDSGLNHDAIFYSGLVSGIEFIKNGITTVIDHHASGKDILGSLNKLKESICDEMGLRGIFCFETSDRFNISECIEENMSFSENKTDQYAGLFGMHASMTLSNQTLKRIASDTKNLPIHIHVAESIEDQIHSLEKYRKKVIYRLEEYDLLRKESILSHCIHLDENEMDVLAKKDIVIALNPTSNMNNGVGLPNYKRMKEKGLTCILGNDGLGYNFTREFHNFFYSMHHRELSPLAISLEDIKIIIRNQYTYAEKILGCSLGRFEKGYKADFMAIPYIAPTEITKENIMGHFFYGVCDNFRPRDLWCNGILRMKDYEIKTDQEEIYDSARKLSKKLWEEVL
ncbi:cytosine/adenosine deaminase-related metal-dependent hydrolase [Natranaerovirga pectinivora]|uniref:Cytosine/adenosine deaminase-related metal-dependent hydrolase n=1 Tax=Natranaerovirga pectinivora TaxID=682400 RepID=A0A4R3MTU6_9FIRM|nr:amidohydrolase family protein [Natranaerovirga pectinivora]TCT16736.1 cytosine/adenosine deaminase-related metal-dependent hydrolase [Natranaerovirga pectinivora]